MLLGGVPARDRILPATLNGEGDGAHRPSLPMPASGERAGHGKRAWWRERRLAMAVRYPLACARGWCGGYARSPDLTRLSQGEVAPYRAPLCGRVDVPTLGWHLSPNHSYLSVKQADVVRTRALRKVRSHNFVEGTITPNGATWRGGSFGWLCITKSQPPQGDVEKGGAALAPRP